MMCGPAEVVLRARVRNGRSPSDAGIGVGVSVVGIDVGVLSIDL